MKSSPSPKKLSYILLKGILSIYFVVVVLVTIIHLSIEYAQTKNDIEQELQGLENIFVESLRTAIWAENSAQVEALVNGIMKLPIVTGIEITNKQSGMAINKMPTQKTNLSHHFDLIYRFEEKSLELGAVTLHSDPSVVFGRVKVGFLLLFFSSLIRSVIM